MYAMLINGHPVKNDDNIELPDGRIVTNPDSELLESLGYKEVIETDEPDYKSGFYYAYHYEETDDKIIKVWDWDEAADGSCGGEAVADDYVPPKTDFERFNAILLGKDV